MACERDGYDAELWKEVGVLSSLAKAKAREYFKKLSRYFNIRLRVYLDKQIRIVNQKWSEGTIYT